MTQETKMVAAYIRTSTTNHTHLQSQLDLIVRSLVDQENLNTGEFIQYIDFG